MMGSGRCWCQENGKERGGMRAGLEIEIGACWDYARLMRRAAEREQSSVSLEMRFVHCAVRDEAPATMCKTALAR
jgi:hypothetical protein